MRQQSVDIPPSGVVGDLAIPENTQGLILFAHGSGSSRFSSRNRFVAEVLQQAHFATLLMDLLTPEEETVDLRTRHLRFDIGLLASRLGDAARWLNGHEQLGKLPVGYFGASTGAAAALVAAAQNPNDVAAVVSRGGRPDLAADALARVQSPTLLVVGGEDHAVVELNQQALKRLACEKKLEIIPEATHLFEEPGTLEQVADLATCWFTQHLQARSNGT